MFGLRHGGAEGTGCRPQTAAPHDQPCGELCGAAIGSITLWDNHELAAVSVESRQRLLGAVRNADAP